ncbi:hypothetical protein GCM10009092_14620 [Bowmanella denitrificans]|uniref:Condensation domain-containing protein n=1 Tax=Bowmanella denitrificans TaxID=366582 RepID=A0ABN0WZQ9_9ALTE
MHMVAFNALLDELSQRQIRVWLEGDELMVEGPEQALDNSIRDRLSQHKTQLKQFLQDEQHPLLQPAGSFPLSHAQLCFWFVYFMMGETANNLSRLIIHGPPQHALLERCISNIVAANDSLRVRIGSLIARQKVQTFPPFCLPFNDLRHMEEAEQEAFVQQLVSDFMRPFDLSKPPLLRSHLVQLTDNQSLLLCSFAHIILDGAGLYLFEQQLMSAYRQALTGQASVQKRPLQIATAVARERRAAQCSFASQSSFWQARLDGFSRTIWPLTHLADKGPSEHFDRNVKLTQDMMQYLHELSVSSRCSIQMLLVAVVAHAVGQVTQQPRVLLNSVLENRVADGSRTLLAPCLYQLPVPLHLGGEIEGLLEQVKKHNVEAMDKLDIPFSVPLGMVARQRWRGKYNGWLAGMIMRLSRALAKLMPVANLYPSYWADYLFTLNPPFNDPTLPRGYRRKKVADPIINVNMLQSVYQPQSGEEKQIIEVLTDKHRFLPAQALDGEWEDETINFYIVADGVEGTMFRITCSCLSPLGIDALERQLNQSLALLLRPQSSSNSCIGGL